MPNRLRRTLAIQIADMLRDSIRGGTLQPGAFLPPLNELASQYAVSRSTIREAVQLLASVGLLESRSGVGTWVRPDAGQTPIHTVAIRRRLGEQDASSLVKARSAIEVSLTELAAKEATPEEIETICDAVEKMESAEDSESWVYADMTFHLAIARAGHNQVLAQFYSVARELLEDWIAEKVVLPGVRQQAEAIQRSIAEAIAAHDTTAARNAALEHQAHLAGLVDASDAATESTRSVTND